MKFNQSGRSMIEMLGVLAIIGVLSVGGIAGYSKAMMKFKINKIAQQITEIVTNIRTLYAQQKNYNGLDTSSAIQMGVIPDDLSINGSSITNAFGGDVEIQYHWYDNESFGIMFSGLPKEACVALAIADWGTTDSSGIVGLDIVDVLSHGMFNITSGCKGTGAVSSNYSYYACADSLPISPRAASLYCTSSYGNGLTLFFK